jgi:hypothetical protein
MSHCTVTWVLGRTLPLTDPLQVWARVMRELRFFFIVASLYCVTARPKKWGRGDIEVDETRWWFVRGRSKGWILRESFQQEPAITITIYDRERTIPLSVQ